MSSSSERFTQQKWTVIEEDICWLLVSTCTHTVCMGVCMCVRAMFMPNVFEGQKKESNSLEVQIQIIASHQMVLDIEIRYTG